MSYKSDPAHHYDPPHHNHSHRDQPHINQELRNYSSPSLAAHSHHYSPHQSFHSSHSKPYSNYSNHHLYSPPKPRSNREHYSPQAYSIGEPYSPQLYSNDSLSRQYSERMQHRSSNTDLNQHYSERMQHQSSNTDLNPPQLYLNDSLSRLNSERMQHRSSNTDLNQPLDPKDPKPSEAPLSKDQKWWLMLHYIPSEHSWCSLFYSRELGDPYTQEQRRWLFIWCLLLIIFQTVCAFWLFHNYEATLQTMKDCFRACQAADPLRCTTHRIEAEDEFGEEWSQTSFSLVTFGDERYFSFYAIPYYSPYYVNYTACSTFRLCVGGSCKNTACTPGCADGNEFYADECEPHDSEQFGLLCRHPDILPLWKKEVWFWVIIPAVFYIVLFPLRNLLLYMCMPLLNHRRCSGLCKCFLYPQYVIFFIVFFLITTAGFSICIHTYRELYHSSFQAALSMVVITCVFAMISAIIFEVPALMLDYWCCKRWKEIEVPEHLWWYPSKSDYIPMEPRPYYYDHQHRVTE